MRLKLVEPYIQSKDMIFREFVTYESDSSSVIVMRFMKEAKIAAYITSN